MIPMRKVFSAGVLFACTAVLLMTFGRTLPGQTADAADMPGRIVLKGPDASGQTSYDTSGWQPASFLGIVDISYPSDTRQFFDRDDEQTWGVESLYKHKLVFVTKMAHRRDRDHFIQIMTISGETRAVLNGLDGQPGHDCTQYEGTMKPYGQALDALMVIVSSPLPNGMYLVFQVFGKDFRDRLNDIEAFFNTLRIHVPQGDDLWQPQEFKGIHFKVLWGMAQENKDDRMNRFKGYDPVSGWKLRFEASWDEVPAEKRMVGDASNIETWSADINGLPVKMYKGINFIEAQIPAPLKSGGYISVGGSVFKPGGKNEEDYRLGSNEGDGQAMIEKMIQTVTIDPDIFDMGALPPEQPPAETPAPCPPAPEPPGGPEPAAPTETPAAAADEQRESLCRIKALRSFHDRTGRNEQMRSDGSPEAMLALSLKAPGRTVESITLKSSQGQQAQWDTIPGNGQWLVVVMENNKPLNAPDGSVKILMEGETRKFHLLVQDNNALASGKGSFMVQIQLDNGEHLEIPVQ